MAATLRVPHVKTITIEIELALVPYLLHCPLIEDVWNHLELDPF